jgi:hypothetical protein
MWREATYLKSGVVELCARMCLVMSYDFWARMLFFLTERAICLQYMLTQSVRKWVRIGMQMTRQEIVASDAHIHRQIKQPTTTNVFFICQQGSNAYLDLPSVFSLLNK